MSRKEELLKVIEGNEILIPVIEDIVFLEKELEDLRKLPQIIVHPKDATRQKATPAAKMYKEKLQQYSLLLKILIRATGADEAEEDSPLRQWMNERLESR